MKYEWDPRKARSNATRHGIRFSDAVSVLEDQRALTIDDPTLEEERYVTIGMDAIGRVLAVVYTWRGDTIRLISARNATRSERMQYSQGEP
jgi:uncharacterized protein